MKLIILLALFIVLCASVENDCYHCRNIDSKDYIIVVDFDTKLNELDMMLENVSSLIAAYRL